GHPDARHPRLHAEPRVPAPGALLASMASWRSRVVGISLKERTRHMAATQTTNAAPSNLATMVHLATMESTQLLTETRSALLLVDVQNRFIYGSSEAEPSSSA